MRTINSQFDLQNSQFDLQNSQFDLHTNLPNIADFWGLSRTSLKSALMFLFPEISTFLNFQKFLKILILQVHVIRLIIARSFRENKFRATRDY